MKRKMTGILLAVMMAEVFVNGTSAFSIAVN